MNGRGRSFYGSFGKKCPIEKSKYTVFHRVYCSLHGTFFMGWAIFWANWGCSVFEHLLRVCVWRSTRNTTGSVGKQVREAESALRNIGLRPRCLYSNGVKPQGQRSAILGYGPPNAHLPRRSLTNDGNHVPPATRTRYGTTAPTLYNAFGVRDRYATFTQGALRDPGLWNATASR